jgi:hypothetical protein
MNWVDLVWVSLALGFGLHEARLERGADGNQLVAAAWAGLSHEAITRLPLPLGRLAARG